MYYNYNGQQLFHVWCILYEKVGYSILQQFMKEFCDIYLYIYINKNIAENWCLSSQFQQTLNSKILTFIKVNNFDRNLKLIY